jgi:hypothetical protein
MTVSRGVTCLAAGPQVNAVVRYHVFSEVSEVVQVSFR